MDQRELRLGEIAVQQHGLFTVRQTLEVGFSRCDGRYRVALGRWQRVGRGVLRAATTPVTARTALLAACLNTRGVASHRAALTLHGLLPEPPLIEVAVPRRQSTAPVDATVYRASDLVSSDLCVVDQIPATTPVRALIDSGLLVSSAQLESMVERGLHRKLFTLDDLLRRHTEIARRGRNGVGPMRELLEVRGALLPPTESDNESLFFQMLRDSGLPLPERQVWVELPGHRFRLDFAYRRLRVGIEMQSVWHVGKQAQASDATRRNLLQLAGWDVLEFWPDQLRDMAGHVVAILSETLRSRGVKWDNYCAKSLQFG